MYEELVKRIRGCSYSDPNGCEECRDCPNAENYYECKQKLALQAADAIEDLAFQNAKWEKAVKTVLDFIPRWIPVTEENHPKSYKPVMVVYIGWNDALPHRDCTAYWSEDEDLWRWAETNDKVKVPITHYMPLPPLPEPPKEET